jgi:polyhydroxyalkanoate synthesis regulator phasin
MLDFKEKYIVNKQQKQVAVQLDIKIFKRIEEVLEDYALTQYMKETKDDEKLNIDEAKAFYKKLVKK